MTTLNSNLASLLGGLFSRQRPRRASHRASLTTGLKNLAFFVYLHCGYVQARDWLLGRLGRSRAVVIYYHRVGGRDVLSKTVEQFRQDLDWFKRRYDCITMRELCERLRNDQPLRRPVLVVSFDDGYRDNFTRAVPALLEMGVPATFYVSTGFVGTDRVFAHDQKAAQNGEASAADPARHPKLTWNDLMRMQDAGFEIGSHTVNHANLGSADAQTIQRELADSLDALDEHLGSRPRGFSFPWGKPRDICPAAISAARQLGYYAVASAYGGANWRGQDAFVIRRADAGNGRLGRLALRARIAGFDPDYFRYKFRGG